MIVRTSWLRSPRTYPCPRAGARARPTTCPRRTPGTGQYCIVSTGQSDSSIMLQVLANQKSVSVAKCPSSPGLRPQDAAGPAPGEAAVPRPPPRPSPDTSARAGSSPDQSQMSIGVS